MAEEQSQRLRKVIHMKRIISLILTVAVTASLLCFSVSAYDILPAPDWVTVSLNADASKTVKIQTPPYMIDKVDYYEYSTDGFLTTETLGDKTGGEFIFDETTQFALRYYSSGILSETYTVNVVISKVTVVTSSSTGISVLIEHGSPIPTDITVSAYEIMYGAVYSSAQNAVGANIPFRLFNVSVMRNNKSYTGEVPFTFLFPADDFDAEYCKIYFMDSKGKVTELDSAAELNTRLCKTELTGFFIIAEDTAYRKGDIDGNGKIQAYDARLALRIASKIDTPSAKQTESGDINKNGAIDASDARIILRAAAGLDKI